MIGRVVSIKMKNTVAVLVESVKTHPLYKKSYSRGKKYLSDDALGVKLGDIVEIVNVRPVSKRKHWRITGVVGRDIEEIVSSELKQEAQQLIGEVIPEETRGENQELSIKQSLPSLQKGGTGQSMRKTSK